MMLYIARGDVTLGRITTNGKGNVIKEEPPKYEDKDDGACVLIGEIDAEKDELGPATSIFADWEAAGYLGEILKRLGKTRPVNFPNFKAITQTMEKYRCWGSENPICEYCMKVDVRDCGCCIVNEWKEEASEG